MGIFSKLFGRKKKPSSEVQSEPKTEEKKPDASDEVTLEEVNESLDEVNTIAKDEPVEKPEPEPTEKEAPEKEASEEKTKPHPPEKDTPVAPAKKTTTPSDEDASDDKPLYHIKKHTDGWQVIKEDADKAYRVFKYQKEAITFADKENLEYQVYKADGTLRK